MKMKDIVLCVLVLGLEKGATQEEIRAKYRELTKLWHPDKVSQLYCKHPITEVTVPRHIFVDLDTLLVAWTHFCRPGHTFFSVWTHFCRSGYTFLGLNTLFFGLDTLLSVCLATLFSAWLHCRSSYTFVGCAIDRFQSIRYSFEECCTCNSSKCVIIIHTSLKPGLKRKKKHWSSQVILLGV